MLLNRRKSFEVGSEIRYQDTPLDAGNRQLKIQNDIVITSAAEFIRLRESEDEKEYGRAANESAPESVWHEVIRIRPDMKAWVARNKQVPLTILKLLSEDNDVQVRFAVAMKKKLDYATFGKLANDPDSTVRQRVAYNTKTPTDVLEQLANDHKAIVREVALERLSNN